MQPVRSQTVPPGSIEGDVINTSTGRGIPSTRVRIQSGLDDPLFATTDAQGHFVFDKLKLQSYRIEVRYPGFLSEKDGAGASNGRSVSIGHFRPAADVRLEMRRSAAIVGRVASAVGVPLEGVSVELLQRDESGQRRDAVPFEDGLPYYIAERTLTNDLGEYRIAPLHAGSYYVRVRPGSNYYSYQPDLRPSDDRLERPTFYPQALKLSEAGRVELAEGAERRADVRMVRQGGVKVSGRILGSPVPAPQGLRESAGLLPMTVGGSGAVAEVRDGRFAIWNVLPGKYVLYATRQDGANPSEHNILASVRRTIEVAVDDLEGIDLSLAPLPEVEVQVAFESGCGAVPVVVQLTSDLRNLWRLHVEPDERPRLQLVPAFYQIHVQPESASRIFATSARLGEAEVLANRFEVTPETKGALRITMNCVRR